MSQSNSVGLIDLQIMWNRLIAVVEEQAQTLMRTAFSPIVRECGDLSAGVFDLQGREVQHVDFGTRTNNVDARRGFRWGSETIDIVAINLRAAGKLAVLRINPDYTQGDAVSLLAGARSSGNDISDDSYGLALYRRPRDGAMFVFDITNGKGPVRQWSLTGDGASIRTTLVRTIGAGSRLASWTVRLMPGESIPSLAGVYAGADWQEREQWDLVGVPFAGHPDLRRLMMPENYASHPLRRDFPSNAPLAPWR